MIHRTQRTPPCTETGARSADSIGLSGSGLTAPAGCCSSTSPALSRVAVGTGGGDGGQLKRRPSIEEARVEHKLHLLKDLPYVFMPGVGSAESGEGADCCPTPRWIGLGESIHETWSESQWPD